MNLSDSISSFLQSQTITILVPLKKTTDHNLFCTHSAVKRSLFAYGDFCLYQGFLKNKKMVGTTKTTEMNQ